MPEADTRPAPTPGTTSARTRRVLQAALALVLVAFAVSLCRRSIVLADEGYLLLQSWDLLNGKVPYRDMDAFVTPGMWVLLAGTFSLSGPSVLASRVPVLLGLLALYAAGARIAWHAAGARAAWGALAGLVVFTVWAFPAWTFAFYSPFSVLFALLALERVLAWRAARGGAAALVAAGAFVGLSIVFKQNYGVFALVAIAASVMATRLEQGRRGGDWVRAWGRDALPVAAGVAAAGLPFLIWLALEGALAAAWQSLVVHPFEFGGRHDIPYLPLSAIFWTDLMKSAEEMLTYAAQPVYRVPPPIPWLYQIDFVERLHVPVFWAPPVVLAIGAALSYRPDDERPIDAALFSVVAMAAMLFLGVFPRADFNHLANVYQPIVVAMAVVAARGLAGRKRAQVALLAVLGLYAAVAAYWYVGLLRHLDTPVPGERAGVLARAEQAQRIDFQVRAIQAEVAPGEALLTVPDLAMLNFLADRPMPSAYYNLYDHHIAHDAGAAVVEGSRARAGDLAVVRFNDFFSDERGVREYAPVLARHLEDDWEPVYKVGREDFVHLRRRPTPAARDRGRSLLPDCDLSRGYQTIREHLLFPALYHDPGTGRDMEAATIETLCRLRVPAEGLVLETRVGYRAPKRVAPGTTLTAELLVLDPSAKTLVARRVFTVEPDPGIPRRVAFDPTLRVDLSRWAGQEVGLILRTIRRGRVEIVPLESRGFGTVWEDPRLLPQGADTGAS